MPTEETKTQDVPVQNPEPVETIVGDLPVEPAAELAPQGEPVKETAPEETLSEEVVAEPVLNEEPVGAVQATAQQPQVRTEIVYQVPPNLVRDLLNKARAKIQERKRKKLDRIMTLFETKPHVTNEDVQEFLRTTKRTATRYFDQLEKEGRVRQVGGVGRGVFYEEIG